MKKTGTALHSCGLSSEPAWCSTPVLSLKGMMTRVRDIQGSQIRILSSGTAAKAS